MQHRISRWLPMAILLAAAGGLAGCNFWQGLGMHQDGAASETNAQVLVADGTAALGRGDYANALNIFQQAVQMDPKNSEARVGFAQAALGARGFNLSTFVNTLIQGSSNNSGAATASQLVDPPDWQCSTYAQCKSFFSSMVNDLNPITTGQTTGPYASNDVTINLNVGFFFLLRADAKVQSISMNFQIQQFSKSSGVQSQLGIPDAIWTLLPQDFYWITNGPTLADLQQIQGDVSAGLQRLQTALTASSGSKQIQDIINLFNSLLLQVNQ